MPRYNYYIHVLIYPCPDHWEQTFPYDCCTTNQNGDKVTEGDMAEWGLGENQAL